METETEGGQRSPKRMGNDELILIAQRSEKKSTKERATRYWRQRQREDKGARNAWETRRILERG